VRFVADARMDLRAAQIEREERREAASDIWLAESRARVAKAFDDYEQVQKKLEARRANSEAINQRLNAINQQFSPNIDALTRTLEACTPRLPQFRRTSPTNVKKSWLKRTVLAISAPSSTCRDKRWSSRY